MADQKITELPENTTPISTDIIPMVDDPGGTPATEKITLANLKKVGFLNSKIISSTRDLAAASGDVAYTGVGFTPTSIVAIATLDNFFIGSVGFSDSSLASRCLFFQPATSVMLGRANLVFFSTAVGSDNTAIVKSYDADGFTLTWTKTGTPSSTGGLYFLCFR